MTNTTFGDEIELVRRHNRHRRHGDLLVYSVDARLQTRSTTQSSGFDAL